MSYGLNRSRTFSGNNRANNNLNGASGSPNLSGYDLPYSGYQNFDNAKSSNPKINGNPYSTPMLSASSPDLHQKPQQYINNNKSTNFNKVSMNYSHFGYSNSSAPDLSRSRSLNVNRNRIGDYGTQNLGSSNAHFANSGVASISNNNNDFSTATIPNKLTPRIDTCANRNNNINTKGLKTAPSQPQPLSDFELILDSIIQDKYIQQRDFNNFDSESKFSLKKATCWLEYYGLTFDQYSQLNKRTLQKQELIFQLIKYLKANSKIDTKNIWNRIGYEFLYNSNVDLVVFPESKQEVYDKFFGYFTSLQHLEELTEKFLYLPLVSELRKNEDIQRLPNFKFFNINNVCMIFNTWIFKIIDAYQLYVNQLIVARFWLDMEKFKTFSQSHKKIIKKQLDFFEWLKLKTEFNYTDLISNYLLTNLQNYTTFFEKLLVFHAAKKASTTYKKTAIVANSLKTFSNQCKAHYSTIEFKNLLTRFTWEHDIVTGNLDFRWRNTKLLRHDKINDSSSSIDYLLLFNNCLVFCKLDVYSKQFILNEFPLPIEFIEIYPSSSSSKSKFDLEAKLIHSGKSLTYKLKFSDNIMRDSWIQLIKETKCSFLKENSTKYPLVLQIVAGNTSQQQIHVPSNDVTEDILLSGLSDLSLSGEDGKATSSVNGRIYCSATIDYNRQQYNIIGTSTGLFIDDINRTGLNWKKLSGIRNIRQIKFLPEYSSLLVLTEEQIVLFDFNNIIKNIVDTSFHLVGRNISNNEKVYFFKLGNVNNDLYVIYRYAKNNNNIQGINNPNDSSFKVFRMNPQRKNFELIQSFDLNDIDCYDIVLLKDTIDVVYISSNQGFFKLILKQISLIPLQIFPNYNLDSRESFTLNQIMFLQKIRELYLPNSNPIKVLEILNNELILVFDRFSVFIDKNTNLISRWDIIVFNCPVRDASFKNGYLVALSNSYIEVFEVYDSLKNKIRYLSHKQVIKASNVALVDSMSAIISVVMDHPLQGNQIVIHLIKKNNAVKNDNGYEEDDDDDDNNDEDDVEGEEEEGSPNTDVYCDDYGNQLQHSAKYLRSKRDSRIQLKDTNRKFIIGNVKMIGVKLSLPNTWGNLWNLSRKDLNNIDPNFLKLQETLYLLLKNEDILNKETSRMHRSIGFSFLNCSFDLLSSSTSTLSYNKDIIFKHTFGCLIPLINFHEKYLLDPMLEMMNNYNRNTPVTPVINIFSKWVKDAKEIYLDYADRLIQSEFFFEVQKFKDLLEGCPSQQGSTLLNKLGNNLQYIQDTLNRYINNLVTLNNIFQKLLAIIQYDNDKLLVSGVDSIIREIYELHDAVSSRLKERKFPVISREISWDLNGKLSILEEFFSNGKHEILKIGECFLQIADTNKYVHNKKRMIMLFEDWILLIKTIPNDYNNYLHVSEEPLHLLRFVYQISKSDSNTINFFNHQGRLLFKICFNDLQEWHGLIDFNSNR